MPAHRSIPGRLNVALLSALAICAFAGRGDAARGSSGKGLQAGTGPSASIADSSAESAALQKQIDALLATAPVSSGRVSIEVRSLRDGRVVYARNPNELLNPASNTKIATAAAALFRLGPEFRYTTDVLADKTYAHGKARELYIKGRGDPSITTERLDGFARDLVHRGLTQIGDLVLDDTQFDREVWGPGWESESSDKPYASGVGALSLNRNSVGIYVLPGDKPGQKARVSLDPEAKGFFDIVNQVQTTKASQRKRALPHTYALEGKTRVSVSGRIPVGSDAILMYRRITDPTFYFGYTLKQVLLQHGVHVLGAVRRGTAPPDAKFVASYDSPELAEIVRDMNKASSNHIAEMLLKTLGAEQVGVPGTWPKGVAAMQDALAELGLAKGSYQLKNGSGLNDTNRFSAHQIAGLLSTLYARFPIAAEFVASLPVAARDGSLRLRMDGTEAAGKMRAKTGTLDRAVALSGFIQAVSGEELVFSLMVNDWGGKVPPIIRTADKFGVLLASVGERPAEQKAKQAQEVAVELPPAEQRARVATYAALAQARDKKHLVMLRAAVRAERDPVVRLAAADALFRTDAESGTGPLLEALGPGPDLLNKLRADAAELKLPMPVLPSLFDLGADGNADALSRLLALCPLARGQVSDDSPNVLTPYATDESLAGAAGSLPAAPGAGPLAFAPDAGQPQTALAAQSAPIEPAPTKPIAPPDEALARALAEGLADVSEASPEETLAAFKSAPVEQARAAAELIGRGFALAKTEMDDSAFAQLVLASAARAEPDAPEARLWVKLIERRGQHFPAASAASTPAAPVPTSPGG